MKSSSLLRLIFILILSAIAAFGASEENVNEQLDASAGGNLVVDVAFGTIDVGSGADNSVTIEAHRKIETGDPAKEKEYLAEVPIVVRKDGNTVTVRARRTEEKSWSWSGTTNMDARYTIRVPKNFNLDLKTGGGTISANGIVGEVKVATGGGKLRLGQLKGPLDARTSGGSIRLDGCDGALMVKTSGGEIKAQDGGGSLDAKTSGGSISVHDFKGDTVVKTSGGQLTFENVGGKMIGQTSGGSITAALVSPLPGEVDLASSAGSIVLSVPTDAACNVQAHTSVGTVSSDLPFMTTRCERDELKGALNGGGKSINLRSSAGSISIRASTPKTAMQ